MCDSLETISNIFSEASEVSEDCDISEDCITLHCNLIAVSLGRIPINLNITLYPCEDPYAVGVLADVTALNIQINDCLLYTSPSPRDRQKSRMPSSA